MMPRILPAVRPSLCQLVAVLALGLTRLPAAGAAERVDYNRDIRPILSHNCFACHGPDQNQRKAKLRLDVRDAALAAKAIVPGKPGESPLVERIFQADPDERMPPVKSNKTLTKKQKDLLKQWVSEGAAYQEHWAFKKPEKPATPNGQSAIDFLVRQRLAKLGLQPSPEADRRTLARRLFFDLIGLPPKPEQVDAFVNDRSPDAYDRLVEALLASPHYGERQAIGWLDVVRFADTIGYHSDNPRNVFPYRDYVINSFNENKRFDRFTVEQLAGDLLPNNTQEQKVASCFNRLLLTTEEGGAQAKDYEARMLTDRVRAVGTVWLGLTLGCCQCHDHKFDPSTQRDFYSMGAFFADIQEPAVGNPGPGMAVPTPAQAAELAALRANITTLQRQLDRPHPELAAGQAEWERLAVAAMDEAKAWVPLRPESVTSDAGVKFTVEKDGTVQTRNDAAGGTDTYRVTVTTGSDAVRGVRLEVLADPSLPAKGPGRAANGNFVLTEFAVTDDAGKPIRLTSATATFEQPGFPAKATIDGASGRQKGWALSGKLGTDQAITFQTAAPVGPRGGAKLRVVMKQLHGGQHIIGRFRLSATGLPPAPPPEIAAVLKVDPAGRNQHQRDALNHFYRGIAPELSAVRASVAEAQKRADAFEAGLPHCLVSVSGSPRVVRLLPRGNWMDDSGPVMKPAVLHFLPRPAEPGDRRLTRLDLANWLVSRDNPLTARVFTNRLWKQFFGTGLSKALDDLGAQGETPHHPELLDWLATEFVDSGWDVKHVVRAIVTSRTYRQASTCSPELHARDPHNRELARQSRFRLDAELVRDNALSVAGLLVPTVGGPSVKPYQPDGYWENLNFPPRQWQADAGENQYRRGLYTWWQRSFVQPSMLAFDAPTREECAADRTRSNIPQQALVLLNDPTYVEAARVFAARIHRDGGNTTAARLRWAWRQALGREPRPDESETARTLLEKHLAHYRAEPTAARAVVSVGFARPPADVDPADLAAWTSVARVILNLHETITRN